MHNPDHAHRAQRFIHVAVASMIQTIIWQGVEATGFNGQVGCILGDRCNWITLAGEKNRPFRAELVTAETL